MATHTTDITDYTTVVEQINTAIREHQAELAKLQSVRDALTDQAERSHQHSIKQTPRKRGSHSTPAPKRPVSKYHQPAKGERQADIRRLLKRGLSPREVADELDCNISYVYTVKNK